MIYFCFGSSMLPALPKFCLIKVISNKNYFVGDIVALKTLDKKFHCHRITEINSNFVSTKGDNLDQQYYEINVPIKNIQGRVLLVYPGKSVKEKFV